MTIKDFFKRTPKDKIIETDSFSGFGFARAEMPCIIEKKNVDYVFYGEENNYPYFLTELLSTSAIHNAIVTTKAKMMAGNGFLLNGAVDEQESENIYNSLPSATKSAYDLFIKNPNGESIHKINNNISRNFQKNGSFALEVIFNMDFTSIATIKYVNTDNIRAGKMENDKVTKYFFHKDWSKYKERGFKPTEIPAFDPQTPEKFTNSEQGLSYNQLIFVRVGDLDYYGEPSYKGAMSWIKIDSQMGLFHLSNIENGFAPSLVFKFYKKPSSPEAQQTVIHNLKKQYSGAKNAGNALVFFSDGKELAPDVDPIQVSNLDKQFLMLADQAVQQIMSGHQVTTPQLFGVNVPGKLGGGTELETGYRIFDNSVVEPDRNLLEEVYNMILKVNKVDVTLEINKFNPLL